MSTTRSFTNTIAQLITQATIITDAGVENIDYGFDAKRKVFSMSFGKRFTVEVPRQGGEFHLSIIRNRLDRLMDKIWDAA